MERTTSVGYKITQDDIVEVLRRHVAQEEGVDPANVEITLEVVPFGSGAFTGSKGTVKATATITETKETQSPTKVVPLHSR